MFNRSSFILVVACALFAASLADPYRGNAWQKQTAKMKFDALMRAIDVDSTPNPWYGTLAEAELFTEEMNTTFDSVGDDMPKQGLFGTEERKKLIHTVGAIAPCKWVALPGQYYSGIFTGADYGFIRFSTATNPASNTFTPGIGLKFLIDGLPSVNTMAMYSLVGQPSDNFFLHDLTNHVPTLGTGAPLAQRLLLKKFLTASNYPSMLGLNTWAATFQNGTSGNRAGFPYRLIFHPTSAVHKLIPDKATKLLEYALQALPVGKPIYDVYATDDVKAPQKIAQIVLTGPATPSLFADKDMFLEHVRMEADFAIQPSFQVKADEQLAYQEKQENFVFNDLPFN